MEFSNPKNIFSFENWMKSNQDLMVRLVDEKGTHEIDGLIFNPSSCGTNRSRA